MDSSLNNGVDNFKAFTGCKDSSEAKQLIEACNGNVEAAVDLYFQQKASSSSYEEPSTSRRRIAHHPKTSQYHLRRSTRNASAASINRRDAQQDDVVMIDDDYVRPPIMPVRGPIVEQSFQEQYQRPRRAHTDSIFESFRDLSAGSGRDSLSQSANGFASSRRSALQNLFRPPYDILYSGSWEAAKAEAEHLSMWLLVNVQNVQEFACQALNRDVWSNSSVKEIIKSNFVFWQVFHDSPDGVRIENYYHLTSHPAVFVVDPRTGELVENFRVPDSVAFCDQVGSFLSANPDFATRDNRIANAAGVGTTKNGGIRRISDDLNEAMDEAMSQCSVNGLRKRRHAPEDHPSVCDSLDQISKKPRKGDLDVDELLDKGNKLTTVDCDEWLKYLGAADGHGRQVSLLLRFPDGGRKKIDVEDTTSLKAIFILAAGLGYGHRDHMLTLFYPKREYLFEDADHTVRELNFNKQEVIHIERK